MHMGFVAIFGIANRFVEIHVVALIIPQPVLNINVCSVRKLSRRSMALDTPEDCFLFSLASKEVRW